MPFKTYEDVVNAIKECHEKVANPNGVESCIRSVSGKFYDDEAQTLTEGVCLGIAEAVRDVYAKPEAQECGSETFDDIVNEIIELDKRSHSVSDANDLISDYRGKHLPEFVSGHSSFCCDVLFDVANRVRRAYVKPFNDQLRAHPLTLAPVADPTDQRKDLTPLIPKYVRVGRRRNAPHNLVTIVEFEDGQKVKVTCGDGEANDPEKAILFAIMKKLFGSEECLTVVNRGVGKMKRALKKMGEN